MSVDFHLPTVCKQHNLLVSNLEVKQPTIKEINSLYFLLNINKFFPTIKIETLVSENQTETLRHDFAPLHLVVKQLSKLQKFSSKNVYKFITVTLGLDFSERINETTPIFIQWMYLHWFLQFLSPVALFTVE